MSVRIAKLLALVVSAWVGASLASDSALARPGTPTDVSVVDCSDAHVASICVYFRNTATEDVRLEAESKPVWGSLVGKAWCDRQPDARRCWGGSSTIIKWADGDSPYKGQLWTFKIRNVAWGTEHCFRLRMRRVNDDMVSQNYSATVCARTDAKPAAPTKPLLSVQYRGTKWLNNPRRQVPDEIFMPFGSSGDSRDTEVAIQHANAQSHLLRYDGVGGYKYRIPEGTDEVTIKACKRSAGGEACTVQVVSTWEQKTRMIDGKRIISSAGKAAPTAPTSPAVPKPPADPELEKWIGTWATVTNSGRQYIMTFTGSGRELSGTFKDIAGNARIGGMISGRVEGSTLNYRYHQPGLSATGTGTFVLTGDGRKFSGNGIVDNPQKTTFSWNGEKVRAAAANPN